MKITVDDIRRYTRNAPEHSRGNFQIVLSGREKNTNLLPEATAIRQFLARQRKIFPQLLWYVGVSKTESRGYCAKTSIKTGNKGRPRIIVKGRRAIPHLHIFLMTRKKDTSAEPTFENLKKFIIKRRLRFPNTKTPKFSKVHGCGMVPYIYRQSEHIFATPDFDFAYFRSPYYDDSPDIFE